MERTVTFIQQGREGQVTYTEGLRTLTGHQEFGGTDVVAIVSMGSADDWRMHHAWAAARRAQILRYVAEEIVRQKATSCRVDIDETSGDIVLRESAAKAAVPDVAWVRRYNELRGKLGLLALGVVLMFGMAMWVWTR